MKCSSEFANFIPIDLEQHKVTLLQNLPKLAEYHVRFFNLFWKKHWKDVLWQSLKQSYEICYNIIMKK